MKIVEQGFEIIESWGSPEIIEKVARTCYKSEEKIGEGTAVKMVKGLRKRGHMAMMEFGGMTVKFTTNRGVTHELVRHRVCSFAQESTRYCDYGDGHIQFIKPVWMNEGFPLNTPITVESFEITSDDFPTAGEAWVTAMLQSEEAYQYLIREGWRPEQAREVLPNSLKTEINVSANFREWQHIFNLRSLGTTGRPHPQMENLMTPLRLLAEQIMPEIFGSLE